ncbi:MAG: hypothetical protein H6817_01605 [Phycisphaerales bacterium]|nr:hypothetical protein [Phycisphaerales bacterium]
MSLLGDELTTEYAVSVADEVCRARIDYVGAVGPKGEWLHDIIDQSDVIREIQEGVRDKVLMTTWHNDVNSIGELADLMTCFDGSSKRLATVFLGSSDDYEMCTRTLREELVLCLKRNEEEEES